MRLSETTNEQIEKLSCPARDLDGSRENWVRSERVREKVKREAQILKGLIGHGLMDDIEY